MVQSRQFSVKRIAPLQRLRNAGLAFVTITATIVAPVQAMPVTPFGAIPVAGFPGVSPTAPHMGLGPLPGGGFNTPFGLSGGRAAATNGFTNPGAMSAFGGLPGTATFGVPVPGALSTPFGPANSTGLPFGISPTGPASILGVSPGIAIPNTPLAGLGLLPRNFAAPAGHISRPGPVLVRLPGGAGFIPVTPFAPSAGLAANPLAIGARGASPSAVLGLPIAPILSAPGTPTSGAFALGAPAIAPTRAASLPAAMITPPNIAALPSISPALANIIAPIAPPPAVPSAPVLAATPSPLISPLGATSAAALSPAITPAAIAPAAAFAGPFAAPLSVGLIATPLAAQQSLLAPSIAPASPLATAFNLPAISLPALTPLSPPPGITVTSPAPINVASAPTTIAPLALPAILVAIPASPLGTATPTSTPAIQPALAATTPALTPNIAPAALTPLGVATPTPTLAVSPATPMAAAQPNTLAPLGNITPVAPNQIAVATPNQAVPATAITATPAAQAVAPIALANIPAASLPVAGATAIASTPVAPATAAAIPAALPALALPARIAAQPLSPLANLFGQPAPAQIALTPSPLAPLPPLAITPLTPQIAAALDGTIADEICHPAFAHARVFPKIWPAKMFDKFVYKFPHPLENVKHFFFVEQHNYHVGNLFFPTLVFHNFWVPSYLIGQYRYGFDVRDPRFVRSALGFANRPVGHHPLFNHPHQGFEAFLSNPDADYYELYLASIFWVNGPHPLYMIEDAMTTRVPLDMYSTMLRGYGPGSYPAAPGYHSLSYGAPDGQVLLGTYSPPLNGFSDTGDPIVAPPNPESAVIDVTQQGYVYPETEEGGGPVSLNNEIKGFATWGTPHSVAYDEDSAVIGSGARSDISGLGQRPDYREDGSAVLQ
ncbi:MAG: hypothetical protein ACPG06_00010 [Alphaproteobacteria bacterium]